MAVCSPEVAPFARRPGVTVVLNSHPEYGMAFSLLLGNEFVPALQRIAVLPADLALIEAENVRALFAVSHAADVTFPSRKDGTPGHPVIFSPRARRGISDLPRGAPISTLRDRRDLTRNVVVIEAPWPYRDVDHESDLRPFEARSSE